MKTITVQIGNSDDKLTQAEWAEFADVIDKLIRACATQMHFMGGPGTWAAWQNVAWMFDCQDDFLGELKIELRTIRQRYRQESIAYLEGETQLI